VIDVTFDLREAIAGDEQYAHEGGLTHTQARCLPRVSS